MGTIIQTLGNWDTILGRLAVDGAMKIFGILSAWLQRNRRSKLFAMIPIGTFLSIMIRNKSGQQKKRAPSSGKKKKKVKVDSVFVKRCFHILTTAIPGWWSEETLHFALLTASLGARTWMTIYMSKVLAMGLKLLCNKESQALAYHTGRFATLGIPAALINSMIKFETNMLQDTIRTRLTKCTHDLYLSKDKNLYLANHVGNTIEHTDQLVCDDINKFSIELTKCYAEVVKPTADFLMFSFTLAETVPLGPLGLGAPMNMYAFFGFAAGISGIVLPSYGRLVSRRQQLEGHFRTAHANLIRDAEMVSFMNGEEIEKKHLNVTYGQLEKHAKHTVFAKLRADVVLGYVNKYLASAVGLFILAIPVMDPAGPFTAMQAGDVAGYFIKVRAIMEGLSQAVIQMFQVHEDLAKLSGITLRVHNLIWRLQNNAEAVASLPMCSHIDPRDPPHMHISDHLKFISVDVYKPDGELLVRNLNFEVPQGRRVIITGENGCGKSSLFRVLRGLWPLVSGTIFKPQDSDIYFLSQVNFVPRGTLRDIIVYPHTRDHLHKRGVTDEQLRHCLEASHLADLECNNVRPTLNDVLDWGTALSPGQKQRMAFARLFYHSPRYAVLDECTNGISPEVEKQLYEQCSTEGITVFSISHKVELKNLHDFELHYNHDKNGTYDWVDLNKKREKASLPKQIDSD